MKRRLLCWLGFHVLMRVEYDRTGLGFFRSNRVCRHCTYNHTLAEYLASEWGGHDH